jgi:hypothetical protein
MTLFAATGSGGCSTLGGALSSAEAVDHHPAAHRVIGVLS